MQLCYNSGIADPSIRLCLWQQLVLWPVGSYGSTCGPHNTCTSQSQYTLTTTQGDVLRWCTRPAGPKMHKRIILLRAAHQLHAALQQTRTSRPRFFASSSRMCNCGRVATTTDCCWAARVALASPTWAIGLKLWTLLFNPVAAKPSYIQNHWGQLGTPPPKTVTTMHRSQSHPGIGSRQAAVALCMSRLSQWSVTEARARRSPARLTNRAPAVPRGPIQRTMCWSGVCWMDGIYIVIIVTQD
jgi:hypothetical protein